MIVYYTQLWNALEILRQLSPVNKDLARAMTHTKKEQERATLHVAIWRIANDLRGSVDGWDFKQYVLGTLFYRFISENFTSYIEADDRRRGLRYEQCHPLHHR